MWLRVAFVFAGLACATSAQADLINPNFTTDLTGWQVSSGASFSTWEHDTAGPLGPDGFANFAQADNNLPVTLFQVFSLSTPDPSQIVSASLSWTQNLESTFFASPFEWSASNYFQVRLFSPTNGAAGTVNPFSTTSGTTNDFGVSTRSANSASLLEFLTKLTSLDTLRLEFEALPGALLTAQVDDIVFDYELAAVPEPSAFALALVAGGAWYRRRRGQKNVAANA